MAKKDPYGDMVKAAQRPVDYMTKFAKAVEKDMKAAGYKKR